MSYTLPIIDGNGNSQMYGNEFEQMYKHELGGNLMIPQNPIIDYNTGSKYTLYDASDGIYNQAKLFENNDDPNEEQQTTDQQAMARIRNTTGINRQLTETEKRFNLYTTNNYDIRFRDQLKNESMKNNDNIFSEFSQDHVNSVRKSNQGYIKEDNLYGEPPKTFEEQLLSAMKDSKNGKSTTNVLLDNLMGQARKEQKTQQGQQKFRDTFAGTTSETMSDKFDRQTKDQPRFEPKPAPTVPEQRARGNPWKPTPKPKDKRSSFAEWFV